MRHIRVLRVRGDYYEMGFEHGRRYGKDIQRFAEERIALVEEGTWSGGAKLSRDEVLALAADCLPDHEAYAPDLMAELRGMGGCGRIVAAGADYSQRFYRFPRYRLCCLCSKSNPAASFVN